AVAVTVEGSGFVHFDELRILTVEDAVRNHRGPERTVGVLHQGANLFARQALGFADGREDALAPFHEAGLGSDPNGAVAIRGEGDHVSPGGKAFLRAEGMKTALVPIADSSAGGADPQASFMVFRQGGNADGVEAIQETEFLKPNAVEASQ